MPRSSFYYKEIKRNYHEVITDVTEFHVGQETLYFSPLMDLANREVIAYNFATRPKFSLVKKMLEQVRLNRQNARLFIATKVYCMAQRNG